MNAIRDRLALARRYPWAEPALVRTLLGEAAASRTELIAKGLQQVDLPGVGPCLAAAEQPLATLACAWRWRVARGFALAVLGLDALSAGRSPARTEDPPADGIFAWRGRTWRVWVDLGSCAPEALGWLRRPPQPAEGVRDVVLTTRPERLALLVEQVERFWPGGPAVAVCLAGTDRVSFARPRRRGTHPAVPALQAAGDAEEPPDAWEIHDIQMARAARLPAASWDVLIAIGNNPLLTATELAAALTRDLAGAEKMAERIRRLVDQGLVERVPDGGQERLVLGAAALSGLACYWGSRPADLQRFLPWPQYRAADGRWGYALRWAARLPAHTRLVRQFALALVESARRTARAERALAVELVSLIGSRLLYAARTPGGRAATRWVVPDALLRLSQHDGTAGTETRQALLVEVDRATNPLTRLAARLDQYTRVWPSLGQDPRPGLVWVIAGSPWREGQILEMMAARGLPGWTVTLERLADRAWWQAHPPGGFPLSAEALGFFAPLRPIWRRPGQGSYASLADPLPGAAAAARQEGSR